MLLSRLTLAENALDHSDLLWRDFGSTYELHRSVWRMFERTPNHERDFLYRLDDSENRVELWIQSNQTPNGRGLWRVESRPIAPDLRKGDLLEFEVRVNPVVSRGRQRHDVVCLAKRALDWKNLAWQDRPPIATLLQSTALEWLRPRAEKHGFRVFESEFLASGYRVERFSGKTRDPNKKIELAMCDLKGILEVCDEEKLLNLWRQGLGPAKGFGCGLILLRRLRR